MCSSDLRSMDCSGGSRGRFRRQDALCDPTHSQLTASVDLASAPRPDAPSAESIAPRRSLPGARVPCVVWASRAPAASTSMTPKVGSAGGAPPLFEKGFQLGDRLEVLGPAGRALRLDQRLETETAAVDAVDLQGHAVREQCFKGAAPDDLTKKVHIADV